MKAKSAAVVMALSLVALAPSTVVAQEGDVGGGVGEYSECDEYMEAYLRSSARKVHRALSGGDYELASLTLPEEMAVSLGDAGQEVVFETFEEHGGQVVGIADRRREWGKTYVVAKVSFGPIIISQSWQARHLRNAGQACAPIFSTVEWPEQVASTVAMEPFEFWGVRVVWRIPWPDNAEVTERGVEEMLRELIGDDGEAAQRGEE